MAHTADDVIFADYPMFHIAGFFGRGLMAIADGMQIVIPSPNGARDKLCTKMKAAKIRTLVLPLGSPLQAAAVLRSIRGTRGVFAERTAEGYFLDFDWNRDALARFGVSVDDAQAAVQNAIETGRSTVERLGGKLILADVIPRPHQDLAALLPK